MSTGKGKSVKQSGDN